MFDKINIANKVFEGISRGISITPVKCTKIKHKSSPCSICYTVCPANAIYVGRPGGTVTIDWDKCTGCGLCISQCPTQVYKLRHGGYKRFIESLIKYISSFGILELACTSCSYERNNIAVVNCIGMFNILDFLVLYLNGASQITIRFGICMECESKHGQKVLEQEIREMENLKEIFEDLQDMEIIRESDNVRLIFPKKHPITEIVEEEKPNPSVNRRGMFSFFKNNLQTSLLKSADMVMVEEVEPRTQITFSHELTPRRRIFLDTIMQLGKIKKTTVTTGRHFNNLFMDESCVYCGMCAKFCNTGALSINSARTELTFNPSKCISCGLCEKACFHGKLHYLPSLELKTFFKDNILVSKN